MLAPAGRQRLAAIFCVVATCAVALIASEWLIRLLLFSPRCAGIALAQKLRDPGLFANKDESDYWILEQHLQAAWYPNPQRIQPLLGWSQVEVDPTNPYGLHPEVTQALLKGGPRVLFFGDSFVRGSTLPPGQIPKLVAARLPAINVIDLSVGGYGFDQTYLMFDASKALEGAENTKLAVVGLMLDDLDRSTLTTRSYQKPYFELDHGRLALNPTPIDRDPEHYLRTAAPSFHSYLARVLEYGVLKQWPTRSRRELAHRTATETLNAAILDQFVADSRYRSLPLLFVVFYGQSDVAATTWQETFIKGELESRGLSYVDTKLILNRYLASHGLERMALYAPDGHHNMLGNTVIAEGILAALPARLRAELLPSK
jgi:hypothetical protein